MLEALGNWIDSFGVYQLMNAYSWLWPVCEMIHFVGMALLIGSIGILDLRVLGFAKGLPISRLEALVPVAIGAFAVNAATGILFVIANPDGGANAYLLNLAFQIKIILILLGGINAIAFYFTGISERTAALGPTDEAPASAKLIAGASIVLWIFVIFFGRLIMYNDTLLWFLGL
ncbi:MAG TPA: hypothetical protein VMR74_09885 [Gammaproteobacteria bacterium]|nr:hypothetical protein [Gammaproteobacteria bacterium]